MTSRSLLNRWAPAAAVAVAVACGDSSTGPEPNPGPAPVASVQVAPDSVDLVAGDTIRLSATPRAADGTPLSRPVTWASLNGSTVSVDATGLVRALSSGRAVVVASSEGKSAQARIGVSPKQETPPPAVAVVEVSPAAAALRVGEETTLRAILKAEDGTVLTDRNVSWRSLDVLVASVDPGGRVTGTGEGRVRIEASSEGRTGAATIDVTVPPPPPPPPVSRVWVSPPSPVIYAGQTVQLSARLEDAQGNVLIGRVVEWLSGDPGLAVVDSTGLVTGVARGRVSVSARSEGVVGSTVVDVRAPISSPVQVWELTWPLGSFYPSVGSAPWVDEHGVSHAAVQVLTSGTITISQADPWNLVYEQRLLISTFLLQGGDGQPVAEREEVDLGAVFYLFDGSGYALRSSLHAGLVMNAVFTGLGEFTVRQTIGEAPETPYVYRTR